MKAAVIAAVGLLVSLGAAPSAPAADLADNYRLADYWSATPFRLYDLNGSVILLDFFKSICTTCQQKIPHVEAELADVFAAEGGNADGLPVTILYVNEGGDADEFIRTNSMDRVADDFYQLAIHDLWTEPGNITIPFYVVINGVSNSPTHAAWEIVGRFGYTNTMATLRAAIDSVRGTVPPRLTAAWSTNGVFEAGFRAQKGRTNVIECSTNWVDWTTVTRLTGSNVVHFTDPLPAGTDPRLYRVRVE